MRRRHGGPQFGPERRSWCSTKPAGTPARASRPDGVHLAPLPPASPELQPAERLWGLVDEPVANRAFADLEALEDVLVARCRVLAADRRTVKARIRFRWWPRERRRRTQ